MDKEWEADATLQLVLKSSKEKVSQIIGINKGIPCQIPA